jgi:Pathogenicity locus
MKTRTDIKDLNKIPNVGPATIRYLNMFGINRPFDLIGQNPYSMHSGLCKNTGKHFDPCLADVFISAVKFMEGAEPRGESIAQYQLMDDLLGKDWLKNNASTDPSFRRFHSPMDRKNSLIDVHKPYYFFHWDQLMKHMKTVV